LRKVDLRRIFRILLLSFLSLLILIVIAGVGLRALYFTDQKINASAIETLSEKFNRELQIDSLRLSLFSGVQMRGLRIYDPPSCGGEVFVKMEAVELRYRLLSLLKKQLEIEKVSIEKPEIFLRQLSDTAWNFSDLLQPPEKPLAAPPDSAPTELPLLFVLRSLEVRNASAHLSGPVEINLSGVNLALESLSFRSPDELSLKALLQITPGDDINLSFVSVSTAPELRATGRLTASLSGEVDSENLSTGELKFDLSDLEIIAEKSLPPLSAGGGLRYAYDMKKDSLDLEEVYFELNRNRLLRAEVFLTSLTGEPRFQLSSKKNGVELAALSELVEVFLPGVQVQGEAYWEDIWARGSREEIEAGMTCGLRDLAAQDSATGLTAHDIDLRANLEVKGSPSNLDVGATASGDFSLQRLSYPLENSLAVTAGEIGGRFAAQLEAAREGAFKAREATLEAGIGDIFGGIASFSASLQNQRPALSGSASIVGVQFDRVPRSPVSGSGGFSLDFSAYNFDDIVCTYQLLTDSLRYHLPKDSVIVEPLEFSGAARLSMEQDLSRIELSDMELTSAGLLNLSASGGVYDLGQDSLKLSLETEIKHNRLSDFLPLELNRSLGGLELAGHTEVKTEIRGRLPTGGEPELKVTTDLGLTDFGMMVPAFNTEVRGLGGELNLSWESNRLDMEGLFRLDWIENYDYLVNPISDCFLSLRASLTNTPAPDQSPPEEMSLFLESFQFDCLSHKFGLVANGLVSDLLTSPVARLSTSFDFRSPEEMTILPEVKASGGLSLRMNLSMKDSLVTLSGSTDFHYLNLEMPPLVSVENMSGHIPFYQKIDLAKMSLVQEAERTSAMYASSPFNYERLRAYNLHRSDHLSNFKIERITAMRFSAQNLEMDVSLGNSGLHIPRVVGSLYDGNLYGNLDLDLKSLVLGGRELDLEEITYRAYLQFSSVNFSEMTGLGETIITEEKSLTGDISLRGRGLPPESDLEAEISITQVSAEVLSRILDFLDPEGTDPGFAMTKTFLDQRFKVIGLIPIRFRPRWFSCPVRHGNLYPSLYADIYSPLPFIRQLIRLPMPIRYDRIPLSVVLAQVGAQEEEF
jgi:hypothetical protein